VVFKHIHDTQEILVRVLLAGAHHVREIRPVRKKKPIPFFIVRVQAFIILHGSVDHGNSVLSACIICNGPILMSEAPESAENATIARSWTSVCFVEKAKEFRDVQQALQYGVAVTQHTGIAQALGFVHPTPEVVPQRASSGSCKGPAFTDSSVLHSSGLPLVWVLGRHGCM
jgi:hypothetical protein